MILAAIDFSWNAVFQIAILAVIFLYVYGIFRGTRSEQMLWGAFTILIGLGTVAYLAKFDVILFILGKLMTIIAIALVVIFQPELRQAFLTIGKRKFLSMGEGGKDEAVDTIAAAAAAMSTTRTGAIIAIERGTHLREWTEDATKVDAPLSRELLLAIFYPGAPLHDGGVVVKGGMIAAARCVFPLSSVELGRGTRHRAALGLSERTDAVVVVVSEETGSISVACEGHLFKDLNRDSLARLLSRLVSDDGLLSRFLGAQRTKEEAGQ